MSPASYQTAPPRVVSRRLEPPQIDESELQLCLETAPPRVVSLGSGKRDSNPRPQPWQGCALPTELFPRRALHCADACSGGEGDRTPDLVNAIHALSQLSYAPDRLPSIRVASSVRREPSTLVGPITSVKQHTSEAVSAPYLMRRPHNPTLHTAGAGTLAGS